MCQQWGVLLGSSPHAVDVFGDPEQVRPDLSGVALECRAEQTLVSHPARCHTCTRSPNLTKRNEEIIYIIQILGSVTAYGFSNTLLSERTRHNERRAPPYLLRVTDAVRLQEVPRTKISTSVTSLGEYANSCFIHLFVGFNRCGKISVCLSIYIYIYSKIRI